MGIFDIMKYFIKKANKHKNNRGKRVDFLHKKCYILESVTKITHDGPSSGLANFEVGESLLAGNS